MSSLAVARRDFAPSRPQGALPGSRGRTRRPAVAVAQRPWSAVALNGDSAASVQFGQIARPPTYAWVLLALAVALHVGALWYLEHHAGAPTTPARKTELALEIAAPPPPKVEPPKPPSPKPQQQRLARAVPQIQAAVPTPSDTPAVATNELPVAAAPIASAEPAPAPPAPVTAPFGKAGYLNNPSPDYPAQAARQGWQGTVTLRVHVLSTGKPDAVEVLRTSGHRPLDDEAIRAVKEWSFLPAKRGDTPIDGWATVPIEFRL
jgi:protein TonB